MQISEFKGMQMVAIREFYEKDGEMLPAKKVCRLPTPSNCPLSSIACFFRSACNSPYLIPTHKPFHLSISHTLVGWCKDSVLTASGHLPHSPTIQRPRRPPPTDRDLPYCQRRECRAAGLRRDSRASGTQKQTSRNSGGRDRRRTSGSR